MDKNIASAMLLRLNKQDQIEALKSIGFTTVNENTPASDIAKYMQWSGTLLDLSLATLRIEDGEQVFFTASEWNSMSANNRSKYIRIGIRLRAECHQFIIAKSDCIDAGGNKTFKWGGYGTDLRGLKNYGSGNQGLYDTFDGKENTDVIIETIGRIPIILLKNYLARGVDFDFAYAIRCHSFTATKDFKIISHIPMYIG
jgi:hypothetical protein